MNSKYTYLLKNTTILTISNFSSKILVFFLVPLYTNYLSTSDYGIFDLIQTSTTLLYSLLSLNISAAVMRYLMDKNNDINAITSIGIIQMIISDIVFSVSLIICRKFNFLASIDSLIMFIIVYYIFYSLRDLLLSYCKGMEHVKELAISGIIETITLITSNIVCLIIIKTGLKGFFVSQILSKFLPCVYLLYKCRKDNFIFIFKNNNLIKKEMVAFSLPLILTSISWWFTESYGKYFVSFILGNSAEGVYSIAYKIPAIINTFQYIFVQAWQISAVKEYSSNDSSVFYGNVLNYLSIGMSILCSFLVIFNKNIASLLFAKDFYAAWKYTPILVVAIVINTISSYFVPILNANMKSKKIARSALFGTIYSLFLTPIFVYYFGIYGASFSMFITSLIIMITRYMYAKKYIFSNKKATIILTLLLITIEAIFEMLSINILINLTILAIIIFLNFKEIKIIFKNCYSYIDNKINRV